MAAGEGNQEGFSEETLKEVKGEAMRVSGGRALWAEGTAPARVLRQHRAGARVLITMVSVDHPGTLEIRGPDWRYIQILDQMDKQRQNPGWGRRARDKGVTFELKGAKGNNQIVVTLLLWACLFFGLGLDCLQCWRLHPGLLYH